MNWRETYEVMTDHCSVTHNFSGCEFKAWKNFRPEYDSNPWPLRYRCSDLLTELSSQLGDSHIGDFVIYHPVEGEERKWMLNIWYFLYSFACFTFYGWIMNSQRDQPPVGLIAQLVEPFADIIEVVHSNPIQVWIFFRPQFHNC